MQQTKLASAMRRDQNVHLAYQSQGPGGAHIADFRGSIANASTLFPNPELGGVGIVTVLDRQANTYFVVNNDVPFSNFMMIGVGAGGLKVDVKIIATDNPDLDPETAVDNFPHTNVSAGENILIYRDPKKTGQRVQEFYKPGYLIIAIGTVDEKHGNDIRLVASRN